MAHPRSVALPEDLSKCKDTIIDVTCNSKVSFILTQSGKLYATGNTKDQKPKKEPKKAVAEEEEKVEISTGGNKKRKDEKKMSKK